MKKPVSFFVMLFILLFTVIGFIFIVFGLKGTAFVFELGLLLAFMFFLAFAMFLIYTDKFASWGIIGAVLMLLLFDVFIIFLLTRSFGLDYVFTTMFALAGIIVALVNILMAPKKESNVTSHYDKKQYYYPMTEKSDVQEAQPSEVKIEAEEQKVVATYTPGKFVGSKKASTFHMPKCDWAQKISQDNQIWFNSREEARAKGYSEHKCQV